MKYTVKHLDALSKAMEEIRSIEEAIVVMNDDDKQERENLREVHKHLYEIYNNLEVG